MLWFANVSPIDCQQMQCDFLFQYACLGIFLSRAYFSFVLLPPNTLYRRLHAHGTFLWCVSSHVSLLCFHSNSFTVISRHFQESSHTWNPPITLFSPPLLLSPPHPLSIISFSSSHLSLFLSFSPITPHSSFLFISRGWDNFFFYWLLLRRVVY